MRRERMLSAIYREPRPRWRSHKVMGRYVARDLIPGMWPEEKVFPEGNEATSLTLAAPQIWNRSTRGASHQNKRVGKVSGAGR